MCVLLGTGCRLDVGNREACGCRVRRALQAVGQASADIGTLLVLGLWGRCDGGADTRLYGQARGAWGKRHEHSAVQK